MKQIYSYTSEHRHADINGIISADQLTRAQKIFEAKTARANYHTILQHGPNNITVYFSVYGTKKICGTYNQTEYIFGASGVLRVKKYDAATNKTDIKLFIY